jgi:hypothetical protein
MRKRFNLLKGGRAGEEPYYRTARNPGPLYYTYIFYFMGTLSSLLTYLSSFPFKDIDGQIYQRRTKTIVTCKQILYLLNQYMTI